MIKIMRPRNRIKIDYVEDAIYIANLWYDLSRHCIEFANAIMLDKESMLIEYDIFARGKEHRVTVNYKEIMDRGESLGAKGIILIHNHACEEHAILSKEDINLINCRKSYYNKYKTEINRIVCCGRDGGQYYGRDIGIHSYTNRGIKELAYGYMKNGVTEKRLKQDCMIVADASSCLKYNTEEKMKRAMDRVAEIAEETKNDPYMYTRTKMDIYLNREKKLYARETKKKQVAV